MSLSDDSFDALRHVLLRADRLPPPTFWQRLRTRIRIWWYHHKPMAWTGLTREQQIAKFLEYPSGICGCGQSMDDHSWYDNHSPTDIPYRRDQVTAWLAWFMGMDWRKQ